MQEVFDWIPLKSHSYQIKLFMLLAVMWSLWTIGKSIEKTFLRSSNEVFYKIFTFMQRWRVLLKERAAIFQDDKIVEVKTWLQAFWKQTDGMEVEGLI